MCVFHLIFKFLMDSMHKILENIVSFGVLNMCPNDKS